MSTILGVNGGANKVNLATAQAADAVSTNILQRQPQVRSAQRQPTMIRLVTAVGTGCDYLFEGSGDGSVWYPLPWTRYLGSSAGAALAPCTGLFHSAGAATYFFTIPVDIPWNFLRVTSINQVGGMTSSYDVWSYS